MMVGLLSQVVDLIFDSIDAFHYLYRMDVVGFSSIACFDIEVTRKKRQTHKGLPLSIVT